MSKITSPAENHVNGYLLYDGSCGACTHFIGEKEKFFSRYGYGVAAIQQQDFRQKINASDEEIAREIFLLKNDGSFLRGANVYRNIFSEIWWLKPISFLSRLPLLSWLFDFCYSKVAENRHRISAACGYKPKMPRSSL